MTSLNPPASPGLKRDLLDLPALGAGVAGVHLVQVAGEQGRLVAAGAGPDLDDELSKSSRRIDQELVLDLGVERVALRPEGGEFLLGHRA